MAFRLLFCPESQLFKTIYKLECRKVKTDPIDVTPQNEDTQTLLGDLMSDEAEAESDKSVDAETGEIIEEVSLFEGDSTKIKEVEND